MQHRDHERDRILDEAELERRSAAGGRHTVAYAGLWDVYLAACAATGATPRAELAPDCSREQHGGYQLADVA